jgi:hypothetical protein
MNDEPKPRFSPTQLAIAGLGGAIVLVIVMMVLVVVSQA